MATAAGTGERSPQGRNRPASSIIPSSRGRTHVTIRGLTATPAVAGFLALPRIRANPHPPYAALRRLDPVHSSPLGAWVLSRHRDVSACIRNGNLSVDERNLDIEWLLSQPLTRLLFGSNLQRRSSPSRELIERLMLFTDPPDHSRLRSLVSSAFTPKAVASVEARVEAILSEILDPLTRRGSMELMSELAYPLPARVICEMLGVPADDHPLIVAHAPIVARRLDPVISREVAIACDHSVTELTAYVGSLITSRRQQPGDDLLSALLSAQQEGTSLTHDELVATVILLLIAGHETTANLIGNGLLTLLRHPPALRQFRDDPSIDRTAIEELLRFDGPIQMTQRIPIEPLEVDDQIIPPGRMVILCLAAANRDPEVFSQPNHLDLRRTPNPHLAFSAGPHFCLGAALARTEARIALRSIIERLPGLTIERPVRWRPSVTIRGVTKLQLNWCAR